MGKKTKHIPKKAPALRKDPARGISASIDRNPFAWALMLFGAAFLVHVFLNMAVNEAPKVVIDEGLYTNIARSLAWDGELAFRGQPINYPYLLYSFLLVPVYWLNRFLGGDVFRYVQVFNTLLVTSSVIPAYLFARDFTKNPRNAFVTAVIVSLMPDMLMGGYTMTECLIWPLALWMVYFCYRSYTGQNLRDGLLTALFAGLMFACKPGAIAMGAVLLTVQLILSLVRKQNVLRAVLSLLTLALIVAAVYGVFLLLYDGRDSILGLYKKQTAEWKAEDLWVAVEAFFLTVFLFVFACGGIFALFPYTHLKEYDREKRVFMLAAGAGILAAILGTAVFVVPYKWTGQLGSLPLHLRYCAMYIPLMYVFTVDTVSRSGKSRAYIAALIAFLILSIFPGARAGFVPGKTNTIDSIALSAFATTRNLNGAITGWIATIFTAVFLLGFLVYALDPGTFSKNRNQVILKAGNVFFVLFLLFNSLCAHINSNIYIDPTISADAAEVNRMVGSERCLGVTQRYYDDIYSYWLDGRLNVPMQQVTIDQMFSEADQTGGVYSPFVPVDQSPNVNSRLTPDTDTLVLGLTIAEHLELNDSAVSAEKTENGHFTVVRFERDKRWADTMMYGLDDNNLYEGDSGCIRIFDESRNLDGYLRLSITAAGSGVLYVGEERIELSGQRETYECTLPFSRQIALTAEGGTARIYGYSTLKK